MQVRSLSKPLFVYCVSPQVTPDKQCGRSVLLEGSERLPLWIPAFAGMTKGEAATIGYAASKGMGVVFAQPLHGGEAIMRIPYQGLDSTPSME
jgi:hypothetical protein